MDAKGKKITILKDLTHATTILEVKKQIQKIKSHLYPGRQLLRLQPKGKPLSDNAILKELDIRGGSQIYLKDLGPQISWKGVFLVEYTGPLVLYLVTYCRPALLYGAVAAAQPKPCVVHIAAACWAFHYLKRLLETLFVHRFSHATMPITNLFKNSSYYWLFGLYIGYYVNHPLYTPPYFGSVQIYLSVAAFLVYELGNLSIHLLLRNLRPPGTKERKIPRPNSNPLTRLYHLVSCPNYTYEVLSWIAFTVMTQCAPAGLFTLAGLYQMTVWALGKHRNYKKEFPSYPKNRKAIVPFII